MASSVDKLLKTPFAKLPFHEKLEVKAMGRETPAIDLECTVPPSTKSNIAGYKRKFHADNYARYPWLTACPKRTKLFCFPCLLFDSDRGSQWSNGGFHSLSNLSKSANAHSKKSSHKSSVIALERLGKERIDIVLSQARAEDVKTHNEEVERNREIISRLVDCVRFLASHELAFRGNDEGELSFNRGNYVDLTRLIAKYDPLLNSHFKSCTVFSGDSSLIQNDIIDCISLCMKENIVAELRDAEFVSIQADEATDVTVQSQFSLSVRYVKDAIVVERFLGFFNVSGQTNSTSLAKFVIAKINELEIGAKLIGQSYDGASTMSGKENGVQHQVQSMFPKAQFVHCHAHRLNLVLQKSVASIPTTKIFFTTLRGLHAFFSRSPKRRELLNQIDSSLHVVNPSQTRWCFNARAIETLARKHHVFVKFFTQAIEIEPGFEGLPYTECQGFLNTPINRQLCFLLACFRSIFGPCKVLFEQLQMIQISIAAAVKRVSSLRETLVALSKPESFVKMLDEADRLRGEPRSDGLPVATRHLGAATDEHLCILHRRVLSSVLDHMEQRFNELDHLEFLTLSHVSEFEKYGESFPEHALQVLAKSRYGTLFNIEELRTELALLYQDDALRGEDISLVLKKINEQGLTVPFAQAAKLLNLILTLPMTTVSSERSFSALGRIKTAFRNRMSDERLSSLALISIESELANTIDNNDVITKFAAMRQRRIKLHRK